MAARKGGSLSEETVPKKKKKEKKRRRKKKEEGNTKVCLKRGCSPASWMGMLLVNESNAHCLLTRAFKPCHAVTIADSS